MIRISLLILLSFVSSFIENIFADSAYLWPLRQNYGISATFGESRDDHFHAGIDISTNGETGLPVLAIADGQIYRLKIQKRAYGKALYIQHSGGIQSVYAHLEGYSQDLGLQRLYLDKASAGGTPYVGDIFIEPPIRVRKGDVVAFSGESGAGLPHLHLELRKNETEVLNPLIYGFQDTFDPVAPTFQAFYLYPTSAESAVNGELETKEIRLRRSSSEYVADQMPVVRGDFFVSASLYDSALRPYHRAPKKISYSIDGRILYVLEFDRFSYSQPQAFGLIYDLGKPGASYYEYPIILSKLVDFPQPFVSSAVPFSTKTLPPGLHQLRIEASDSNENTSAATLSFIVNDPPRMELREIRFADEKLEVSTTVSDPNWNTSQAKTIAADVQYSLDLGKTFHPFTISSLEPQSDRGIMRFQSAVLLSDLGKLPNNLLIKARGFDGVEYSATTLKMLQIQNYTLRQISKPAPSGTLRYVPFGSAIQVLFDTAEMLADPPTVYVGASATPYPLESHGMTSYQAIVPVPKMNGPLLLKMNEKQSLSVPVQFLSKSNPSRVMGENYRINLDSDALYWDTFVWPRSLPGYAAKLLPFVGSILQLGPRGLPLRSRGQLSFTYPSNISHPERLSIYSWNRSEQKWVSLPSIVDQGAHLVQTKISYFDLYALMYDNVAPLISHIFPKRRSSTTNPTPTLAVSIQDRGMDVDDEKVVFYVDGIAYKAEYDPDRNVATVKINTPLRKGYHRFSAVAFDYGGNRSELSRVSFRVR